MEWKVFICAFPKNKNVPFIIKINKNQTNKHIKTNKNKSRNGKNNIKVLSSISFHLFLTQIKKLYVMLEKGWLFVVMFWK